MQLPRKKYVTETEGEEAPQQKKQAFSLRLLRQQKAEQLAKLTAFGQRCLVIAAVILVTCMGHVYFSIATLVIASLIYKAIISQKKNEELIKRNVFFANIDWYVYVVTFYSLLPRLFLRKDLF